MWSLGEIGCGEDAAFVWPRSRDQDRDGSGACHALGGLARADDDQSSVRPIRDRENTRVRRSRLQLDRNRPVSAYQRIEPASDGLPRLLFDCALHGGIDTCVLREQHADHECFRQHVTYEQ